MAGLFSLGPIGKRPGEGQPGRPKEQSEPPATPKDDNKPARKEPRPAPKNQGRFAYGDYVTEQQINGLDFVTYEEFQGGHR